MSQPQASLRRGALRVTLLVPGVHRPRQLIEHLVAAALPPAHLHTLLLRRRHPPDAPVVELREVPALVRELLEPVVVQHHAGHVRERPIAVDVRLAVEPLVAEHAAAVQDPFDLDLVVLVRDALDDAVGDEVRAVASHRRQPVVRPRVREHARQLRHELDDEADLLPAEESQLRDEAPVRRREHLAPQAVRHLRQNPVLVHGRPVAELRLHLHAHRALQVHAAALLLQVVLDLHELLLHHDLCRGPARREGRQATDGVTEDGGADEHDDRREEAFRVVDGEDVPVPHRGHGRERPVERRHVPRPDVALIDAVRAPPRCALPVVGVAGLQAVVRPEAAEEVPDEHEDEHELEDPYGRRPDALREVLDGLDLAELEHPHELDEPEEAQRAHELQRPQRAPAARDRLDDLVDGHGREEVDPEPPRHVVIPDPIGQRHVEPVVIEVRRAEAEDDVDEEHPVRHVVDDLPLGGRGQVEADAHGDDGDGDDDEHAHEHVPVHLERVARVPYQPRAQVGVRLRVLHDVVPDAVQRSDGLDDNAGRRREVDVHALGEVHEALVHPRGVPPLRLPSARDRRRVDARKVDAVIGDESAVAEDLLLDVDPLARPHRIHLEDLRDQLILLLHARVEQRHDTLVLRQRRGHVHVRDPEERRLHGAHIVAPRGGVLHRRPQLHIEALLEDAEEDLSPTGHRDEPVHAALVHEVALRDEVALLRDVLRRLGLHRLHLRDHVHDEHDVAVVEELHLPHRLLVHVEGYSRLHEVGERRERRLRREDRDAVAVELDVLRHGLLQGDGDAPLDEVVLDLVDALLFRRRGGVPRVHDERHRRDDETEGGGAEELRDEREDALIYRGTKDVAVPNGHHGSDSEVHRRDVL
mmetsp:Transcript_23550/g.73906  ORF Transcript_23550/g.73906 Transcript_23550/m.73906 type:complete len:869 (-) Transcript_23550:779-3385(-)